MKKISNEKAINTFNLVKKIVANGLVAYLGFAIAYVMFFFLFIYFKRVTNDSHITYIIVTSIFTILNINVMIIIFFLKYRKIAKKLNDILEKLGK